MALSFMESCKNGLCAFDGKIWTKIMKIWWNHVTHVIRLQDELDIKTVS